MRGGGLKIGGQGPNDQLSHVPHKHTPHTMGSRAVPSTPTPVGQGAPSQDSGHLVISNQVAHRNHLQSVYSDSGSLEWGSGNRAINRLHRGP